MKRFVVLVDYIFIVKKILVKLCEDSKIVDIGDKLKTSKFIISNKRSIWDNEELRQICKRTN